MPIWTIKTIRRNGQLVEIAEPVNIDEPNTVSITITGIQPEDRVYITTNHTGNPKYKAPAFDDDFGYDNGDTFYEKD